MAKGTDPQRMRPKKVRRARIRDVVLPEMMEPMLCSARMIGNGCVMVENHCGLCALGDAKIAVATKCGLLEVRGSGLTLSEVRQDTLIVRGRIFSVGYAHG